MRRREGIGYFFSSAEFVSAKWLNVIQNEIALPSNKN
jgi:hypothetical protein